MEKSGDKQHTSPLRQYRLERGWSQKYVADRLHDLYYETYSQEHPNQPNPPDIGVNSDMVGKWERLEKTPIPIYQKLLCQLYEVTRKELDFSKKQNHMLFTQVKHVEKAFYTSDLVSKQGVRQKLIAYLQKYKKQILGALTPGSTYLRMEDIIGVGGLFISPAWTLSHGDPSSINIIEYLMASLREGQKVLLLGEAGQGKTTILKYLFILLVEQFSTDFTEEAMLPLYIPLRELMPPVGTATEMLWALVDNSSSFPLSCEELASLLQKDQVICLFDGFDEIKGDLTQRSINERASSKLFTLPGILSCRTNFYKSYLSTSALQEIYPQCIELNPLTTSITHILSTKWRDQYKAVLHNEHLNVNNIVNSIQSNQGLRDLAQRPLLLIMMLDVFADFQELLDHQWSIAKLYQKYTEKWLKNEATKPDSVLRWHEKSALIEEIAWSLHVSQVSFIPYERYQSGIFAQRDVSNALKHHISSYKHIAWFQLVDDICFRTFLLENEGDKYYFIHKSFQEYYVGKYIFERLRNKNLSSEKLTAILQVFLPVDITSFLKDMLKSLSSYRHDSEIIVDNLIRINENGRGSDHRSAVARQNTSHFLAYLGTPRAIQFLENSYEDEPNKWVQRSMMVGLALLCEKEDMLERYIEMIYKDPEAASINLGYHLVYYGDQAPEEGYYDQGGARCDGTLRTIFRHLEHEQYQTGWALDLLTLRLLIKGRGVAILNGHEQYKEFINKFINQEHLKRCAAFYQEKELLKTLL